MEMIYNVELDYGTLSSWWDECAAAGLVKDNKVQLGEDFLVEHDNFNYEIKSYGHSLFKFIRNEASKNTKLLPIELQITAVCTKKQFYIIYAAFSTQVDDHFSELLTNAQIKEMVDAPNSAAIIASLVKKYSHD